MVHRRRVTALFLVSFCVALAMLSASSLAPAASPPTLLAAFSTTTPFEARPAVVGGWTGDGTGFVGGADGDPNSEDNLGHITWRSWRPRSATGHGVVWVRREYSCTGPHCWTSEPTRIRAFRVRRHHHTRMSFSCDAGEGRHRFAFRLYHTTWFGIPAGKHGRHRGARGRARTSQRGGANFDEPLAADSAPATASGLRLPAYRRCGSGRTEPAAWVADLHHVARRTACRVARKIIAHPWPESDWDYFDQVCVNRLAKVHRFGRWNVKAPNHGLSRLSRGRAWFSFQGQD